MTENIKKPRPIFDRPNVLVAGGAGFIGSWLCEELLKTHKVICIDDFSTGRRDNIEFLLQDSNFVFLKWDLTQPIQLEELPELQRFQIKFQGLQEIYNLACPTNTLDYLKYAVTTAMANSILVFNLLELARRYEAKFLQVSSASVYGPIASQSEALKEDYIGMVDQLAERGSYNEGKRFAESVVATYNRVYGLETKIARIFNVFGPKMAAGSGRMIPDFVEQSLNGEPLVIYGNQETKATYCYVVDIIDGLMRQMAAPGFTCFNLGSPIAVSIQEVALQIKDLVGSDSPIKYVSALEHTGLPPVPNIAKAKAALNWFPLTPLEQGLKATVDYVVSHRGLVGMH